MSPQNAAPSGVLFALAGSATEAAEPLNAPQPVRPTCSTAPEVNVTARQVLPTTTCAADASVRRTTAPSGMPDGHAWLSTQFAPATKSCPRVSATESGFEQPDASLICPLTWMKSPARTS